MWRIKTTTWTNPVFNLIAVITIGWGVDELAVEPLDCVADDENVYQIVIRAIAIQTQQ